MKKIKVIVVPETEDYIRETSYLEEIYINKNLGIPKLDYHNAKYVAPCWLNKNPKGVNRLFHIKKVYLKSDCTILKLGNSFLLESVWNKMGSHRKFEYHSLDDFGFKEITDGLIF